MKKIIARVIVGFWILIPLVFVTYWKIWPQFLIALGGGLLIFIILKSFLWAGEHWNG